MPNTPPDVTNGAPHQESYTDNGDGTVTDNITGLMWQQSVSNTYYNWGSVSTAGTAQYYCATLQLAGHSDWRLPTIIEMISVMDPSLWSSGAPMMNATYFPGLGSPLNAPYFVTATAAAGPVQGVSNQTSPAWSIYFTATGDPWTFNTPGGLVRCVR